MDNNEEKCIDCRELRVHVDTLHTCVESLERRLTGLIRACMILSQRIATLEMHIQLVSKEPNEEG